MAIVDKKGVLQRLDFDHPIELELGCGDRKRVPHALGVDVLDYECVDIVGDILEVLALVPEGSVTAIHAHHVIEHIGDLSALMEALARVMQRGGTIYFVVPHFSNPYFYSDYTHKSFFGLYTFSYLTVDRLFQRKVPTYQRAMKFELAKVDLVFKSTRPFFARHALKAAIGMIFNLSRYTKELYEENFCYLFPCYEIRYQLKRL
jgi:hypothetical protein